MLCPYLSNEEVLDKQATMGYPESTVWINSQYRICISTSNFSKSIAFLSNHRSFTTHQTQPEALLIS
jgi:hypothetical protein